MRYYYVFTISFVEIPIKAAAEGRWVSKINIALSDGSSAFRETAKACKFNGSSWNQETVFKVASQFLKSRCGQVTAILKIPQELVKGDETCD